MSCKLKTVKISDDTKKALAKLKEALSKVTGKKFTYDDTLWFLIDYLMNCDLEDCPRKVSPEKEILKRKKELLLRGVGAFETLDDYVSLEEIKKNVFYVPDRLAEGLKSLAEKNKTSVDSILLNVLETGLLVYGRFFLLLSDPELNAKLKEVMENIPREEGLKELSEINKRFKAFMRGEILRLRKKYRKLLPNGKGKGK